MSSLIFALPETLDWKKAYLTAVLEKNRNEVPMLVQKAKEKLSQRLHELWAIDRVPCDESEAIDDALYLLDALLSSLPYRHDIRLWGDRDGDEG